MNLELKFHRVKKYVSGRIVAYFKGPNDRSSFNLENLLLRKKAKELLKLDVSEEDKAIEAIEAKELSKRGKLRIYRPEEQDLD